MKMFEYPLLALTLAEVECNKIMTPVLNVDLPNMGICSSMTRSLVYIPTKNKGVGINKLYTTQGILHVGEIRNHIGKKTVTGELLHTSIEYTKIKVVTGWVLFKLTFDLFLAFIQRDLGETHVYIHL